MATTIAEVVSTFPVDQWDVVGSVERSLSLTSFFGGTTERKCLQLTVGQSFVPLTRTNVARLLEALRLWMADVDSERIPELLEARDVRLAGKFQTYEFLPANFNHANVFGVAVWQRPDGPALRIMFSRALNATELSPDQACLLAAYLVSLAGDGAHERFDAMLARLGR